MVRHDVAGTVRQEQIVQYIQHSTCNRWGEGGGGDALPLKKVLGHLPPCSYTTMYTTHNPVTHQSEYK